MIVIFNGALFKTSEKRVICSYRTLDRNFRKSERSLFSMKWSGTVRKQRKLRFFTVITLLLVLAACSHAKAADNIVIGMAG